MSSVSHILYRSHLFTPISRESPSILLDFTDLASTNAGEEGFAQKKIQFTFYHLTYRYDVDSKWLDRCSAMFKHLNDESQRGGDVLGSPDQATSKRADSKISPSLTRVS